MVGSMTDAELCKASCQGREEAFVELVRRYQGAVCAVTYAISGEHALSEDLAQDTFLVAWKKLPGIAAPDRVGPWLTGIARNLSRRSRRRAGPEPLAETSGSHPVEPDADPEEAIVEQQDRARVWRLLGTLPERIREAMVLYYREEQSASRVAELLGISIAATEQRLSRGRKQLRVKVERELDRELADALGRTRPSEDFTRKVAAVLPLGVPTALSADQLAEAVAQPSPVAVVGAVTQGVVMKKLVAAIVAVLAIVAVTVTVSSGSEPSPQTSPRADEGSAHSRAARGETAGELAATAGRVGGSVVADGGSVVGAVVTLATPAGTPVVLRRDGQAIGLAVGRTGEDGRFSIENVPPGRYIPTATAAGHLPATGEPFVLEPDDMREDLVLSLAKGGHTLAGRVLDIGGGGVEGAVVRAKPRGGPTYAALTDAEGGYAVTLPDGSYGITAWEADYQPAEDFVVVAGDDRTSDLTLVPGAAIFGTVIDRVSGKPVAGATVSFSMERARALGGSSRRARDDELAITGPDGTFALRQLGAAEYQLEAVADHRASRAAASVSLAIAEQLTDVVVIVESAANAKGVVLDAEERPVPDVDVEAVSMGDLPPVRGRTGADGSFVLAGLGVGKYSMIVAGEGILTSTMETTFDVGTEDVDGLRVPVQRGTTLRGRVQPAMAAQVSLRPGTSVTGFAVFTVGRKAKDAFGPSAADGTFALTSVPTGSWRVIATAADGSYGEAEVTITDAGLEDVVVELTPRATVRGVVVDEAGEAIAGAKVSIEPEGPPGPVRADGITDETDENGRFELVGVVEGKHRVLANDRHGSRLLEVGAALDRPGTPVEVEDGAAPSVRLEVTRPAGEVAGEILDADGGPHADAWVTLSPASGEGFRGRFGRVRAPTVSGPDGTFRFEGLPDGRYTVAVASRKGDAVAEVSDVEVGTTDLQVQLEALASLAGKVTSGGRPVTQFEVHAGIELGRTFVSDDGRFSVERLDPKELEITIVAAQGAVTRVVGLRSGVRATETFALEPWGRVTGRVVGTDGTSRSDVAVQVRARGGERDHSQRLVDELSGAPLSTGADGRFVVEGIGTGRGSLGFGGGGVLSGKPIRGQVLFFVEPGGTTDVGDVVVLDAADGLDEEAGILGLSLAAGYDAPGTEHLGATMVPPDGPGSLWVDEVEPGSPADAAGLRVGQCVRSIDGVDVERMGAGTAELLLGPARIEAGHRYTIVVEGDDGPNTVQLVARARPPVGR